MKIWIFLITGISSSLSITYFYQNGKRMVEKCKAAISYNRNRERVGDVGFSQMMLEIAYNK